MHLSVYFFGLEGLESRELFELLSGSDDVDDIDVSLSRDRVRPGEIDASAEFAHFAITMVAVAVAGVLKGASSEAGKDLYVMSKDRVRRRLKKWVDARNGEAHRERIRFTMTESGEMLVAMRAAQSQDD